jgi:uncharacterized protein
VTSLRSKYVAFLCLLPPLVLVGIQAFHLTRFSLLVYGQYLIVITALLGLIAYKQKFSKHELGLQKPTRKEVLIYGATTCVLAFLILLMISYNPIRSLHFPEWNSYYIRYVLLFCPAQEFIYRSFLFAVLKRVGLTKPAVFIGISSLTYAWAHVLLLDGITIGITLLIGIIWGFLYQKYPNFWGVSVSHALLGALSIATGLI